ncbi:LIM domain-containing protein WLIM1-like [Heracleum sosnowskyi]|uniref:LIM domain-containing protein WLIM1-like n=1 Tax=Heracleum sosnowskyi TaxID=360622 RepID=A0AAD8H1C7_9APIA|nr:LIM domain-containing protein WLIM1-like [Heracleum sosnowskyi]
MLPTPAGCCTILTHLFIQSFPHLFSGTTQKCKACEKTVYVMDELTADNKVYHRSCFRCHHCKGTLKLFNYSSFEGVLYCKPHFDQLFKMTGSLDKSFEGTSKTRVDRSADQGQTNTRISRMFGGTQEKCVACKKTVYPIEKVAVDGIAYHKACFKCSHGGCYISPSNFVAHEHQIYCRHHHSQLFKAKGNFSQLVKQDQIKEVVEQDQVKEVIKQDQVKEVVKQDIVKDADKQDQVTDVVKPDEVKEVTENATMS